MDTATAPGGTTVPAGSGAGIPPDERSSRLARDAGDHVSRAEAGLRIERRFTRGPDGARIDPTETVEWERRDCRIFNSDGSVVFEAEGVEIPASWSTIAGDVMASKYMRKAGVPVRDAQGHPVLDERGEPVTTGETSTRQVVHRLVSCWRHWGQRNGYFRSSEDAAVFEDELSYMLLHQMTAPNSPQWFNTGLSLSYGISGPSQGHYYVDPESEELRISRDAYSRPQPHACFIQSVGDDLVNAGGIMDLWVREARLFKYGSGTGTNFSAIRGEGEPLAGGGVSSGLMSFLKIGDRAAGAIKSGGTTRRAAKMVCLDLDHPDVEAFVNWKAAEERKVRILVAAGMDPDFNGEAYATVSGQNSNNSVRVPESFLRTLAEDGEWQLRWRTDGRVSKTLKARDLWKQICEAAWQCADPGVQFDTTINEWHTCSSSGRINASNPCSEYMFLDNTACNLASLNLVKFFDVERQQFDIEGFRHACRLWTVVLEISVLMAQYPSPEIADLSYRYRTLGLGYANLGTLLMLCGIPYDSDAGRGLAGAVTAIMSSESYATSAEMASFLGPFPGYEANREPMLRVMRNHRRTAYDAPASAYESLSVIPQGVDPTHCPEDLLLAAREGWDRAVELGERYGYRNAQVTVIAPTGTIGLLMDCDTTGIEPDFSLVKFKKLAGGGYFKIPNRSVSVALSVLGYEGEQIEAMMRYLVGSGQLEGAPHVHRLRLLEKGLRDEELEAVEKALPQAFELESVFNAWTLGEECMRRLGIPAERYQAPGFRLLVELGFSNEEISAANDHICGRHTLEGAPYLRDEHLPVFDCANRCGKIGRRFIAPDGHLRMMAAAQPFISGAISKTINMPHESTVEQISDAYKASWQLGLKAVALYRDGCKASQPLSSGTDRKKSASEEAESSPAAADTAGDTAGATAASEQGVASEPAVAVAPDGDAYPRRRRPLPAKRHGFTQEARVGGHKIYLRTGEYEDGALGEIFIDMHKEGAAFRGIMNCFAIAVSKGLQYGVPLDEFIDTFTFTRFAPQGQVVGHPNVKMATSVLDYVFRTLALEYRGRVDLVHVRPPAAHEPDPADQHDASDPGASDPGASDPGGEPQGGRAPANGAGIRAGGGSLAEAPSDVRAGSNGGGIHPAAGERGPIVEEEVASTRTRISAEDRLGRYLSPAPGAEGNDFAYAEQMEEFMGDAPPCDRCGHITIRSGSCYRCIVCGESLGCS